MLSFLQRSMNHPLKHIVPYYPNRAFGFQTAGVLVVPGVSKSTVGGRAFRFQGPLWWNQLPVSVWNTDTLPALKIRLQAFLFDKVRAGSRALRHPFSDAAMDLTAGRPSMIHWVLYM